MPEIAQSPLPPLAAPEPPPNPEALFTPTRRWYVLVVETGAERRIAKDAADRSLEIYFPVSKRAERDHRRQKINEVERPAFGRYLFAAVTLANPEFARYLAIDGVLDILSNDGAPEPIAESAIAEIKRQEAAGAYDQVIRQARGRALTPRWVKVGHRVRIVGGVYATLGFVIATIIEVLRQGAVKVELSFFGRLTRTEIPLAFIERGK